MLTDVVAYDSMEGQSMLDVVRYETPAATHRLLGWSCTGYGATARKTWACERRTLDGYAVVYVSAGSGWIETSATTGRLPIEGHALVWLFPGVMHAYAPDARWWTEQWIMFEGTLPETFTRLGFLSPARPVTPVDAVPEIATIFAQIQTDFLAGGPLAGLLAATLAQRLIVVAHGGDRPSLSGDTPSSRGVRRAVACLDEQALRPLDFEAIARESGMGYSTLRRRFKEATGYSPKEYVLRIRLSRAKALLTLTSQSVEDIAAAVGFDDPYYFSRLFRHKEGMAPTRFRAQQQAGRGQETQDAGQPIDRSATAMS
jgi:AraC family transcriptional regulator of arabinose operon